MKIKEIMRVMVVIGLLSMSGGTVFAQTYKALEVDSAATDPVEIFDFTTPTGNPVADTVVIGRFVIDFPTPGNPDDELTFRLDTHNVTKFPFPQFKVGGGNVTLLDTDLGTAVVVLRARVRTETSLPPGYRIIEVSVRYNPEYSFAGADGGQTWRIKAEPEASDVHFWGFWNAGVGEDAIASSVKAPKLIEVGVTPEDYARNMSLGTDFLSTYTMDFGKVHVDLSAEYAPNKVYEFRNVGTDSIVITDVTPSSDTGLSPFQIPSYFSGGSVILPMGTLSHVVTFRPTATGPVATKTVTLGTNHSDLVLNLEGSGNKLHTAVVLDLSGSMLKDINEDYNKPAEEQKIYFARAAAYQFAKFYREISPEAEMGLYSYPNMNADCPSSGTYAPLGTYKSDAEFAVWTNRLFSPLNHADLLVPNNGGAQTPLAEGISKAFEVLSAVQSEYDTATALFLGDGQHSTSCNSAPPRRTPQDWYSWPNFASQGIPFNSIPYGKLDETWTGDWESTFKTLSSVTNGRYFPANVNITDSNHNEVLQEEFMHALAAIEGLETLVDPGSSITANQTKQHKVCVTESTQELVFSVHWGAFDPDAIDVTLETPTGSAINQIVAEGSNSVGYLSGENFAGYVVRGDYLRGHNGVGQWVLKVKGKQNITYTYQVFARDWITAEVDVNLSINPAVLTVAFPSKVIKPDTVEVNANFSMPTQSYQTLLARAEINPKVLAKTPETIEGRELTWAERKAYAFNEKEKKLGSALKRVANRVRFAKLEQVDNMPARMKAKFKKPIAENTAVMFQATLPSAIHDGLYDFIFNITGTTASGDCFQRQYPHWERVDVLLEAEMLPGQIIIHKDPKEVFDGHLVFLSDEMKEILKSEAPEGMVQEVVQIEPKDTNGNFFGIGKADQVTFELRGAEKVGGTLDMLDGSYYQVIQYKKNPTEPISARVKIGNIESVDKVLVEVPLPPPPPLTIWWIIAIIIVLIVIFIIRKRKTA